MMPYRLCAVLLAAAALFGGVWAWGESRYQAGYAAAETQAEQQYQAAAERLRDMQYHASQAYQAARAEREAAEKLRKGKVHEITQRDNYQRDCIDADGLRELNAAIGKKSAAR